MDAPTLLMDIPQLMRSPPALDFSHFSHTNTSPMFATSDYSHQRVLPQPHTFEIAIPSASLSFDAPPATRLLPLLPPTLPPVPTHCQVPHSQAPHSQAPHAEPPSTETSTSSSSCAPRRRPTRPPARKPLTKPTHTCHVCKRTYSRKDNLRAHFRIHSGEKPYKCTDCGTGFRWLPTLSKHQRTGCATRREHAARADDCSSTDVGEDHAISSPQSGSLDTTEPRAVVVDTVPRAMAEQLVAVEQGFDCEKVGLDWLLATPVLKQEAKVSQQSVQNNPLMNLFFSELGGNSKANMTTTTTSSTITDHTTPSMRFFPSDNDSLWM